MPHLRPKMATARIEITISAPEIVYQIRRWPMKS